ncbi:MAG TPA: pyruvate kinase [Paludibacteraceae bacterium]|nr:pyruvate kinase [Paludibacteraceae bacterium]HPS11007.1 pyruvate kinase [Paludibacteraceae bacterium]
MTQKFTKIVATISDKRCEVDFIRQLYQEGMNVVRMNSAHLQREGFLRIINNVREVSHRIAILIDTKGPEVRTTIAENDSILLKTGDTVKVTGDVDLVSTKDCIAVNYPHFVRDLHVGDDILIDDGEIDLKVVTKDDNFLICTVLNDGKLGSRKSVNVPGVRINLPSLTPKDKENILFAIEQNVDFIAHSFVRSKQDLLDIQEILDAHNSPIKIISKIENQEGVDNIDEIIQHCYGVMVARGDLGIEVPQERIPGIQRKLIRKCVKAHKPVIVATQMLHSMIENPRPTRAEVNDVANAIYYRTDALMLSGETAYGKYPIEAVRTMATIALEAENTKMPENDIPIEFGKGNVTAYLAHAAAEAGKNIDIKAIITDTFSGRTARYLASYRSSDPILAFCYNERASRELALSYGVYSYYKEELVEDERNYFTTLLHNIIGRGIISPEDIICYLSGPTSGSFGTTFLEINTANTLLSEIDNYTLKK